MIILSRGTAANADVFCYVDEKGVYHFSSTPTDAGPGTAGAWACHLRAVAGPRPAADYDHIIHETSREYGVEPALVKALIHVESGFDPSAESPRGARGLMQLMPATAQSHGVEDLGNPHDNIRGGIRHLRSLLDRFKNDARLAVAAYNAGAAAVHRHRGLPPFRETRKYVARVFKFRAQYLKETRRAGANSVSKDAA